MRDVKATRRNLVLRVGVALSSLVALGASHCEAVGKAPQPPGETSWASFRNGNEQRGVAGSSLPEQLELLWEYKTEFSPAT